jgi:hypothetical protein
VGWSSNTTISSTQNTEKARASVPARYVFWSCDLALAIILPGSATVRVVERGPLGVKTAVGLEVSTSELPLEHAPFGAWSALFRFCVPVSLLRDTSSVVAYLFSCHNDVNHLMRLDVKILRKVKLMPSPSFPLVRESASATFTAW